MMSGIIHELMMLLNDMQTFLNECVNSYVTIYKYVIHSTWQTLLPFLLMFILKGNLSLVAGVNGNFRLSGDRFFGVPLQNFNTV